MGGPPGTSQLMFSAHRFSEFLHLLPAPPRPTMAGTKQRKKRRRHGLVACAYVRFSKNVVARGDVASKHLGLVYQHCDQDDFFAGKTISVVVGSSAGGGYDLYARVLSKHMGRHLPGNPRMITQNMPGAGGGMRACRAKARHAITPSLARSPRYGNVSLLTASSLSARTQHRQPPSTRSLFCIPLSPRAELGCSAEGPPYHHIPRTRLSRVDGRKWRAD